MSCNRADTVLHAYFDNELDALDAAEFERHIVECPECASGLAALKSLRSSMSGARLFEKMPSSVRKKVLDDVHAAKPVPIAPARTSWRWLAVAAALLLCTFA